MRDRTEEQASKLTELINKWETIRGFEQDYNKILREFWKQADKSGRSPTLNESEFYAFLELHREIDEGEHGILYPLLNQAGQAWALIREYA